MELEELADSLRQIMKDGASIVNSNHKKKQHVQVKSKNSLVTDMDKKLEKFFVEQLQRLIPEAGFIAEEGTSDKKGVDYNWIIDPLDGTTNFIHGIPAYCASIALMQGREIVLGAVLEFNSGEYFHAIKGQGAYLNDERIRTSLSTCVEDSLMSTGFPYYDFDHMEAYILMLRNLMKESRGLRRIGSAALDLAYVACGRFDGFFEYSLHPWDVAAGILLVQEAGGKVSDFKGGQNQLFGKQILATNEFIYDDMLSKSLKYFT
jgi:myo-inositol-1(or 4)-monophosphatase